MCWDPAVIQAFGIAAFKVLAGLAVIVAIARGFK